VFNLSHRRALVTGAGQGMGAGIALALAEQGALVFVNDLFPDRAANTVKTITEIGGEALPLPGDITDKAVRAAMQSNIMDNGKALDILVNNAGVPIGMPESLRQYDALQAQDYAHQLDLNFYAIQDFCQRFVPAMRAQKHGRILIITSEAHRLGQEYGLTHYAAAKSAALGLMRNLSREVGRDGVTFNALSLGAMDNFDDFTGIAAKMTAVGRAGSASDVGAASLYLVSDEASWMTGQTIALNGGSSTA
jgi:2-hydroxycyclohexanecarboxyl-CoA dehydrogenase